MRDARYIYENSIWENHKKLTTSLQMELSLFEKPMFIYIHELKHTERNISSKY